MCVCVCNGPPGLTFFDDSGLDRSKSVGFVVFLVSRIAPDLRFPRFLRSHRFGRKIRNFGFQNVSYHAYLGFNKKSQHFFENASKVHVPC